MVERDRRAHERAMWGAWQGERFARVEKLRPWKNYAKEVRKVAPGAKPKNGSRIGAYRSLAAAGAPLKITKLRKPS